MLTLRDLQSTKTHQVPPSGAVLGREGGDADILVRDKSVSKHHARLYAMDGVWWLEDLNSANGTFVADERISNPVPLDPGVGFTLSNYQFEVVKISGTDAGANFQDASGPRTRVGGNPLDDDGAISEGTNPPSRGGAKPKEKPRQQPSQSSGPKGGKTPPPAAGNKGKAPARPSPTAVDDDFADAVDLSGDHMAAGSPLANLPKAIAHYMVTVPKLLFNPLGTIRDSIENQKFPAMKGMPLLGWALPGLAIQLLLGFLATLVVVTVTAIRGGGFAIGTLIMAPIIAVISAIVGGAIIAFLYHPIFEFIVNKLLKGNSDEKSRTNYLIISQSGLIITAVPAALTIIFALLVGFLPGSAARVGPFIMLLPALVNLAAQLISLAIAYFWFKYFEVMKWVPIVILVLMVLSAVGVVFQSLGAVRAAISGGGGGTVSMGGTGGTVGTVDTSHMTAEQKAAYEKSLAAAEKARADAEKAQKDAQARLNGKGTPAAAETRVAGATPEKTAPPERNTPERSTPEPRATEDASTRPGGTLVAVVDHGGGTEPPAGTGAGNPNGTPYERYAFRRDQIERAIAADPTLLTHDAGLLDLYKRLHAEQNAARKQFSKGPVAPDDVVTQRLIDAKTFEMTGQLVDQIHARMFKN